MQVTSSNNCFLLYPQLIISLKFLSESKIGGKYRKQWEIVSSSHEILKVGSASSKTTGSLFSKGWVQAASFTLTQQGREQWERNKILNVFPLPACLLVSMMWSKSSWLAIVNSLSNLDTISQLVTKFSKKSHIYLATWLHSLRKTALPNSYFW